MNSRIHICYDFFFNRQTEKKKLFCQKSLFSFWNIRETNWWKHVKNSFFRKHFINYNFLHFLGQEAMDVTTTSTKIGKFDARFFHMVYENEEFSRLKGHFGPINSVQFHPDGQSYASGGEDGYVRINTFDKAYHDFKFEA